MLSKNHEGFEIEFDGFGKFSKTLHFNAVLSSQKKSKNGKTLSPDFSLAF